MKEQDAIRKISLQELFPKWKEMEEDDSCFIDFGNLKRPEHILGLADELDIHKGLSIALTKGDDEYNNHFVLRFYDGRETIAEHYLNDDLTEEIVYDRDGKEITVATDKANAEKYDKLYEDDDERDY